MTLLDDHLEYLKSYSNILFHKYQTLRERYLKDKINILTLNGYLKSQFDESTLIMISTIYSSVDAVLTCIDRDPKDIERIDYLYEKEINHFKNTFTKHLKAWDFYFSKLSKTLEDCERLVYIRNEYNKTYKS